MADILYRLPPRAGMAIVNMVLDGVLPHGYPESPGTPGVKWPGVPRRAVPYETWMAISFQGWIHGWVRYCCNLPHERTWFGLPPEETSGRFLYYSRVHRLPNPIPVPGISASRSHYLTPAELHVLGEQGDLPEPDSGEPCVWTGADGEVHQGCCHCEHSGEP